MYTITARLVSKSLLKKGETAGVAWEMITFIVQKQHKKKQKKIVFVAFNKLAKQIINIPKNERITITFYPHCTEHKGTWYTSLKVIDIQKYVSKKRIKEAVRNGAEPIPEKDYTIHDDRPLFENLDGK